MASYCTSTGRWCTAQHVHLINNAFCVYGKNTGQLHYRNTVGGTVVHTCIHCLRLHKAVPVPVVQHQAQAYYIQFDGTKWDHVHQTDSIVIFLVRYYFLYECPCECHCYAEKSVHARVVQCVKPCYPSCRLRIVVASKNVDSGCCVCCFRVMFAAWRIAAAPVLHYSNGIVAAR